MPPRSSPLSRSLEQPTTHQRRALIRELLEHLEGDAPQLTPMEVLRSARFVPGWTLKNGTTGQVDIDCPQRAGLRLPRDQAVAFLQATWIQEARAAVGEPEDP